MSLPKYPFQVGCRSCLSSRSHTCQNLGKIFSIQPLQEPRCVKGRLTPFSHFQHLLESDKARRFHIYCVWNSFFSPRDVRTGTLYGTVPAPFCHALCVRGSTQKLR